MRKFFYTVALLAAVLGNVMNAGTIVVPKDKLNALADALKTAAAGDVFLLERGGYYANVGVITLTVPVTLQATGTSKLRPVIFQAAKVDGTYDTRDFQLNGSSFTATGIHFDADHGDASWTRWSLTTGVAGMTLRLDGCAFTNYFGRSIDLSSADNKLFITNSIFSGDVKRTGFDEGRPIDARQYGHDTIFVQNTTFLNVTDRFFRHYTGSGYQPLDVVVFDHCTFAHGYGYRPGFQFGLVKKLVFTNNIVFNPGMMGTEKWTIRVNEADYAEKDIRIFSAVKVDSIKTSIQMTNNNMYVEKSILDIFAANKDSISAAPWFNAEFKSRIDSAAAMFQEALTFTNAPGAPLPVITAFARSPRTPVLQTAMNLRHPDSISFAYATTAKSYTAAPGGFPVGDLNWFPVRKAAWELAGKPNTPVAAVTGSLPVNYAVGQNYPNPFNPSTVITYQLPSQSVVTITAFDLLGRTVATLVNGQKNAGSYSVVWNAAGLTSGIYFYTFHAAGSNGRVYTETKKMLLTR